MEPTRIGSSLTIGVVAGMASLALWSAPAHAAQECHDAYTGTCVPSEIGDVDCDQLNTYVRLSDPSVDPYRLDADSDGIGCEQNGYEASNDRSRDSAGHSPDDGHDHGMLPLTGPRGSAAAGVGGALVVGGAALLLLARRREVHDTA